MPKTKMKLIKTENHEEKRVLPRFPYCFLTFKGKDSHVFEVIDISHDGMQIALKDGGHEYLEGESLNGNIHWKSLALDVTGSVKWISGARVGVKFAEEAGFKAKLTEFLSTKNIIKGIIPLHTGRLDLEIPSNLRYWLRADGPVELFVWQHNDGELSKFQMIVMQEFVEWQDGVGLKTGRIKSHRDVEVSMSTEEEFTFQFDDHVDIAKMKKISEIVDHIPAKYLPTDAKEFLNFKLQARAS